MKCSVENREQTSEFSPVSSRIRWTPGGATKCLVENRNKQATLLWYKFSVVQFKGGVAVCS